MSDIEKLSANISKGIQPWKPRSPFQPEKERWEAQVDAKRYLISNTVEKVTHSVETTAQGSSVTFTLEHNDGRKEVMRPIKIRKGFGIHTVEIESSYPIKGVTASKWIVVTYLELKKKEPEDPFSIPGPGWNYSADSKAH